MGEANVKARLTEDQVREIRADKTTPIAAQAKRFGVAPVTIRNAKSRATWKHVA
jgi:uncharacterized protein YjcR